MTFVKTAEPITAPARLRARNLGVGYGERLVLDGLDVDLPAGELTVIVGPNGCGKSTLLRALARMVPARAGSVELDGKPIGDYPTRQVARRLGLLPQSPVAPDGITVTDLVARGRYPHQGIFRQWSDTDADAVDDAMRRAGVTDLAGRQVSQLSGGQRQRVWIAMALAQQTPILLLDEPTTYLDVAHQVEVLRLTRSLQRDGYTVVVVLHDLHQALRYATRLLVMKAGRIIAPGAPGEIFNAQLLEDE